MMTREMRMEMVGESQDEKHWGMHRPSLERGRCLPLSASGFSALGNG